MGTNNRTTNIAPSTPAAAETTLLVAQSAQPAPHDSRQDGQVADQLEPVGKTINMSHIKTHYFTSHPQLNSFAIIPKHTGPDLNQPM